MLSIVIPTYNEEERIGKTLEEYGKFYLEKSSEGLKNEIIVVINNTVDNTLKIVKQYMEKYPNIRYLDLLYGGKGYAILEGFKEAKGEIVGFVDADMATSPEAFYDLFVNLKDYDGIIGSRWIKGSKTKRS